VTRDEQSKPALLRAQPSVRALVIGEIPAGTLLGVLAEERGDAVSATSNVWYRVTWSGQTGYVFSGLVAPT
jgi:hypothetical protein